MQMVNNRAEQKKYGMKGNAELLQLKESDKKALIVKALEGAGYRPTEQAALLNINRSYVTALNKKKEGGILAPLKSLYKRNIKSLAKGQLVGDMKEIKGSDVLGALKEIGARIDPIIQRVESKSLNINLDISPEDRDRYKALLGIQGTQEATGSNE